MKIFFLTLQFIFLLNISATFAHELIIVKNFKQHSPCPRSQDMCLLFAIDADNQASLISGPAPDAAILIRKTNLAILRDDKYDQGDSGIEAIPLHTLLLQLRDHKDGATLPIKGREKENCSKATEYTLTPDTIDKLLPHLGVIAKKLGPLCNYSIPILVQLIPDDISLQRLQRFSGHRQFYHMTLGIFNTTPERAKDQNFWDHIAKIVSHLTPEKFYETQFQFDNTKELGNSLTLICASGQMLKKFHQNIHERGLFDKKWDCILFLNTESAPPDDFVPHISLGKKDAHSKTDAESQSIPVKFKHMNLFTHRDNAILWGDINHSPCTWQAIN